MKGKRKQGRPRKTWRLQVEESRSVSLKREDVKNRARWIVKWERLLAEWGKSGHPHLFISATFLFHFYLMRAVVEQSKAYN